MNSPQRYLFLVLSSVATVIVLLSARAGIVAATDLSVRLFGRSYPVTQTYLNPSSRTTRNPTPDGQHAGIDYGALADTVVRAVKGGQVLPTPGGPYGTVAVFDGQNTVIYLHLRKIYVRKDQKIGEGTEIGEVGGVGAPGGKAHLHLEVRRGKHELAVYTNSGKSTAELTLDPSKYL